jgi:hypothetical protein
MKKCPSCHYLVKCLGAWDRKIDLIACSKCCTLFITHVISYDGVYLKLTEVIPFGKEDPECWRRKPAPRFICRSCQLQESWR